MFKKKIREKKRSASFHVFYLFIFRAAVGSHLCVFVTAGTDHAEVIIIFSSVKGY